MVFMNLLGKYCAILPGSQHYLLWVGFTCSCIDLRYAKVTPGLTVTKEDQASNAFHIE